MRGYQALIYLKASENVRPDPRRATFSEGELTNNKKRKSDLLKGDV